MMTFTGREILLSALYALIYGGGFSFVYQLLIILVRTVKAMPSLAVEILNADKIFPSPRVKNAINKGKEGALFAFFSVVLFFIGFQLLSYLALDGQLRIYMLALSSAAFYITNLAFYTFLRIICITLFDIIILLLSTAVRVLVLPVKKVASLIKRRKISKIT